MTTTPNTPETTAVVVQEASPLQVAKGWIDGFLVELTRALPRGLISPDRFARVALNAISNQPKLAECTKPSLLLAFMRSAQLGLEPDGLLGQAYVIPYHNKKANNGRGGYEANFQIGYQGFMVLAERSGLLSGPPVARVVREADRFEFWYGLEGDHFKHIPYSGPVEEAGEITHAYCIVRLKQGAPLLTVYTIGKVEQHRDRSQARDDGPWKTDYEAMVIKTMIRVGLKYAPKSVSNVAQEQLQRALKLDEAGDMGLSIDLSPEEVKLMGPKKTTLDVATLGAGAVTTDSVMSGQATGVNDAQGGPKPAAKPDAGPCTHPEISERVKALPPNRALVCPQCNSEVRGTGPAAAPPAATGAKSAKRGPKDQAPAEVASEAPTTPSDVQSAGQDDLFEGGS